ncbi:hypothetical protein GCM10023188_10560 [Pontibacter saemangeumensis]|uniref:Uncharacterized protein n=1 Tax=Pontibacter saemangeumensis TaxID=1084525 RepID=A0ABP8LEM7_9BACT
MLDFAANKLLLSVKSRHDLAGMMHLWHGESIFPLNCYYTSDNGYECALNLGIKLPITDESICKS